jgi:hypothetical protein
MTASPGNFSPPTDFFRCSTIACAARGSPGYADGMRRSRRQVAALIISNSLLLPIGVITALVWANLAPRSYVHLADKAHKSPPDLASDDDDRG